MSLGRAALVAVCAFTVFFAAGAIFDGPALENYVHSFNETSRASNANSDFWFWMWVLDSNDSYDYYNDDDEPSIFDFVSALIGICLLALLLPVIAYAAFHAPLLTCFFMVVLAVLVVANSECKDERRRRKWKSN